MAIKIKIKNFLKFIVKFLQLQTFLFTVTLPIQTWWGLPISLATFFGNLIFSPFIIIFLLLSSLIFFTEIFNLPNYLLIYFLEMLNEIWLFILSLGNKSWLIAFIKPSFFILLIFIILVLFILHLKQYKYFSIYNLILLFCFLLYGNIKQQNFFIETLEIGNKKTCLIKTSNELLIDDLGLMTSNSFQTIHEYKTLILQKTGSLKIDHLIITKPSIKTFQNLNLFCKKFSIKNIYISKFFAKFTNNSLNEYFEFIKNIKNLKINLFFIEKQPIIILLENNHNLTIVPEIKLTRKSNIQYYLITTIYK